MSKKIRKWSDGYGEYGFTYITEPDRSQRPQCTICDAKLSNSSLAPVKLKEHFLKMHGDGKYKNTTLDEFKIKRASVAASIAFRSLNPVSLVYRVAYVCFVSMFPYLALFLTRLALY